MSSPQTESLHLTRVPIAETGMLIRKPVAEVFEAIVNPEITTKFWFTRSSGLKALLEHLVGDRYPKGVDEHELTKD